MRPPASALPVDFQTIFNASPGNYLLLSSDLTIIGVTDAYLTATMTARDQITGRPLFEIFPDNPDDPMATGVRNLHASLERVLMHKRADRMPVQKYDIRRPVDKGGGFEERFWSPVNCPVLGQDGEVRCIIHCVEDVTDFMQLRHQMREEQDILREELRTRAEKLDAEVFLRVEAVEASKQLAESERRYRFLVDAVPQLLWTAKADGSVNFCNARWFEFTHLTLEQLRGDGWQQTIHPEDRDRTLAAWVEAVRSGAERFHIEHRIRRHDGTYHWMLTTALAYRDARGDVVEWLGTTTDIHDRVTAEEKLLQVERLQAVGKLAGGVAHEVNTLLTVVIGCARFALEDLGPTHEQKAELGEIIRAASRASDVTRQLLAYSRQQVLAPTVVDLSRVINELTPTLKRLIGSDRELAVTHAAQGLRVKADRGQIEQVLINLVANARDATETDGLIRIESDVVRLDQDVLASYQEVESIPGEYARIAVRDNGAGMSAEVTARVFEPFFTTKAIGEGTGLGLSMVYGIAKQSGGFVKVDSRPGGGTVVAMHLPLGGRPVDSGTGCVVPRTGNGGTDSGRGRRTPGTCDHQTSVAAPGVRGPRGAHRRSRARFSLEASRRGRSGAHGHRDAARERAGARSAPPRGTPGRAGAVHVRLRWRRHPTAGSDASGIPLSPETLHPRGVVHPGIQTDESQEHSARVGDAGSSD
jgi:PAS domain S-box-containing protein